MQLPQTYETKFPESRQDLHIGNVKKGRWACSVQFSGGGVFNCPRGFLCNKKECHVGIRKLDVHHLEIFSQGYENLQTVNQFVLPFVELFSVILLFMGVGTRFYRLVDYYYKLLLAFLASLRIRVLIRTNGLSMPKSSLRYFFQNEFCH